MEKQVDKITALEEATSIMVKKVDTDANVEEAAVRNSTLEKITNMFEKQNDRKTNVEQAIMKIQEQSNKIANLEEAIKRMEKQDIRLTSLEATNAKNKDQADKRTQLGEFTNKMDKQVDRIIALEEFVRQVNNKTTGITNIENEVQHLNKKIENLENITLSNEKAVSDVTRLVKDNDLKELSELSEFSINAIKKNIMKQSVAIRRMVSAEKMYVRGMKESCDKKLSNFTNEVKLQMSTLKASVESQISSFETILKVSEKTASDALNETFLYFHQEIVTTVNENEQKLEVLQEISELESDHHRKTMNKANGEIQQLKTKIGNVESRQGKRAAFKVTGAYWPRLNVIMRFSNVLLNEGSVFNAREGEFTSPFPGIYGFVASLIEKDDLNSVKSCFIRSNYYEIIANVILNSNGNVRRASAVATLHLIQGDRVSVWCYSSNDKSDISTSAFSGFLISADP